MSPTPIIFAALLLFCLPANAAIKVVDGDTIELDGERIRLAGVDTPESDQMCDEKYQGQYPCGREATEFLTNFIDGKTVTCDKVAVDKYKRTIATCFADDKNISEALVRSGMAVPYHIGGKRYKDSAAAAKKEGIGLWYGAFMEPANWRKQKRKKR